MSGSVGLWTIVAVMTCVGRVAAEDAPAAGAAVAPASGEARAAWITERVADAASAAPAGDRAIAQLLAADRDGDCTGPLIALLADRKLDTGVLVRLVRALGRDGLAAAAVPVAGLLDAKDAWVVANAAVSLEYIGHGDKKVLTALKRLASTTEDEVVAAHAYRALGRCGRGDAAVRTLLLDKAASGKSEFATFGPCIGLAYFERDEAAMRGVEKLLKGIGVPGSRRGGGTNTVKRGLVSWTLAQVGDAKSAAFVREDLVGGLKNVKAFWVEGLATFWRTVADVCAGARDRMPEVEEGVRGFVQFAKAGDLQRYGAEVRSLDDAARAGRASAGFVPKGDGLLETR
jgi:hypothetical protein